MPTPTNINVELRPHPAVAQLDGKPLIADDGTPVPLLPDQRSVWLNGLMVGYCGANPGTPLSFIVGPRRLPPAVREIVATKVAELRGGSASKTTVVPDPEDIPSVGGDE